MSSKKLVWSLMNPPQKGGDDGLIQPRGDAFHIALSAMLWLESFSDRQDFGNEEYPYWNTFIVTGRSLIHITQVSKGLDLTAQSFL